MTFAALSRLGRTAAAFRRDERGFVLSAELVLILTIGVLALIVGINAVAKAVNNELFDVASAIGAVNQSYGMTGFVNEHGNAWFAPRGFGFVDRSDECDCAAMLTGRGRVGVDTGYAVTPGVAYSAPVAPVCPTGDCPPPVVEAVPCPAGWPCEPAPPCPTGDCPPALGPDGQPLPSGETGPLRPTPEPESSLPNGPLHVEPAM